MFARDQREVVDVDQSKHDACQFVTLCMPIYIYHFNLPGITVQLVILLPFRVVVAVVATTSSFLCAVVANHPPVFPSLSWFIFPIILWPGWCVRGGDAGDSCGVDMAIVGHSKQ